jgi:phosphonate transport system ATP-binding protein
MDPFIAFEPPYYVPYLESELNREVCPTVGGSSSASTLNFAQAPVSIRGVTKKFGGAQPLTALDRVDLDVKRGELCVLIGLSGSGKSTLLRHVNGLHLPTSGSVHVLGVDVTKASRKELRALRKRVGFVFQNFNLVPRATVLENVLTGALGRLRGPRFGVIGYSKKLRAEAAQHLERVGLGDRLFQRTGTLSGGQQQRVGIARMLMQGPELVLADEPVASLDPEASRTVMDLLFQICQEDGLTVICSLHQVELALAHGTRLVGLRDGVIVLDTPTSEIDVAGAMQVYHRLGAEPSTDQIPASVVDLREELASA